MSSARISSAPPIRFTTRSGVNTGFGGAVALSGATAAVSAPAEGAVYVFARLGALWRLQATLTESGGDQSDQFGAALALSGSTLVIGAPSATGAAFVFTRSGGHWHEQARLAPRDLHYAAEFGASVAVSGSTVLAGAPYATDPTVYVFVRHGQRWSQQAELKVRAGNHAYLGWSVALAGSTAVLGAPPSQRPDSTFYGAGAAYVFTRTAQGWRQTTKLVPSHSEVGDQFGSAVAVSGAEALIGAYLPGHGEAYLFADAGKGWRQGARLGPPATTRGAAEFGLSVALAGSVAIVGAPFHFPQAAVYEFKDRGNTWRRTRAFITGTNRLATDGLGSSVALDGTTAIAGAPEAIGQRGAAYLFANL